MKQIDIKAGKMTFGQRIELGKLFQDTQTSETDKYEQVFEILHSKKPSILEYKKLYPYFLEIVEGMKFWIEQEKKLLKYDPTTEELQAGIRELSEKVGEFGTVKALAKAYGKDPDEVLNWEYAKVFGILYTDLQEHLFQRRFDKVIQQKYKTK